MSDKIIVELGCGPNKLKGAIGVDKLNIEGVDIVADLENGLPFFQDNSLDEIHSSHFLEHVTNFELLMNEIFRVIKKEGKIYIKVPHFSNPYFYSDFTHKRFFGLYSFDYFNKPENQLKHKVPSFYSQTSFRVVKRKLIFKSDFILRSIFKHRLIEPIINISSYTQELYEESFCYIIPCQELLFEMIPNK